MKKLAMVALLLFAAACTSMSLSPSTAAKGGSGEIALHAKSPTHYVLLSDPKYARELDSHARHGSFYVAGFMTATGFDPVGKVEGKGKLCSDGKEWVDLKNLVVHPAGDTPVAPYVTGCRTRMGAFVPSTRDVVLQ